MHYYTFNIGDYASHTKGLSLLEDLAYRRLLDAYYLAERPLNGCSTDVARSLGMRDNATEVEYVLKTFFAQDDGGAWVNDRADREIKHFQQKSEAASRAGKASAERRFNDRSTDVQQSFNERQLTNNQEPRTNNHIEGNSPEPRFPDCPHEEILKLWGKHLPHLAQPRVWEGNRRTALRLRWIQASRPSAYSEKGYSTPSGGLEWWSEFFDYIATGTKLADGFESQGRSWKPDLEWVINSANFQKIIDGKYTK